MIAERIRNFFRRMNSDERIGFCCGVFFSAVVLLFFALPIPDYRIKGSSSLIIYSAERSMLRHFQTDDGGYSQWRSISEFPSYLVDAAVSAEDRRFYFHPGVDPLSVMRAVKQNALSHGVVSGGSTITQQLARIAYRDIMPENRFLRKLVEIPFAMRLELHCSKREILESYLNRIPLRNNNTGFGSASARLFGRDLRFLTREESVALVVLLRGTQVSKNGFLKRYRALWKKLYPEAECDTDSVVRSLFYGESRIAFESDTRTQHFENWIRNIDPSLAGDFYTSISENINTQIHAILNTELAFIEQFGAENGAVVVMRLPHDGNPRLELVAMVGSKNFYGDFDGQVNGAVSIRSAGSSLKPLVYALAMDKKGYKPYTILNDIDTSIATDNGETYHPRNNDLLFWGPMTLREALATSRNVPAVATVCDVGVSNFYNLLIRAGFYHLDQSPDYYGPGIILGSGGASLMQLTRAYSAIANKGVLLPIFIGQDSHGHPLEYGKKDRLFSEINSWKITSILSDREVRRRAFGGRNFLDFPFDVAAKTGTSKDYRDSWTIGYSSEYVVGVWIGNFSGRPMREISGGWGAGRVFHQVMRLLTNRGKPRFIYPDDFSFVRLCRKSGKLARSDCPSYTEIVDSADKQFDRCALSHHGGSDDGYAVVKNDSPVVISPVNGETYILDPTISLKHQMIPVRIINGTGDTQYSYCVDNGNQKRITARVEETLQLARGEHSMKLLKNGKEVQSILFTVE
jgi:penicillin-binding protein 1C